MKENEYEIHDTTIFITVMCKVMEALRTIQIVDFTYFYVFLRMAIQESYRFYVFLRNFTYGNYAFYASLRNFT